MGRVRAFIVASLSVVAIAALFAPGCRDATQVTLEIGLGGNAKCPEIKGTAITVGVDPRETEGRVGSGFVTASTPACDVGSRAIGTLVVTPSDSDSASVIVIVGYGGTSPETCKPPLYKGCIVSRRHFSFAEHKKLRLPITIDPECQDVPCDAFSTCRVGKCFSSESPCDGDVCAEPGALPDGGTNPDAEVMTDGGGDGPITNDSGNDGGDSGDAGDGGEAGDGGDAGKTFPYCMPSQQIHCADPTTGADVVCGAPNVCCEVAAGSPISCVDRSKCDQGGPPVYCCTDASCNPNTEVCSGFGGPTGQCSLKGGASGATCANGVLSCPDLCEPPSMLACCASPGFGPMCTGTGICPMMTQRYCCDQSDCGDPAQGLCPLSVVDGPAQPCKGPDKL
jgi:hypothetical protein